MKECDVPVAFPLDLGYRTLSVPAGKRYYTDEVAGAMPQYVVEARGPSGEDHPMEGLADHPDDEPQHPTRSKRS
jgi:hypothetical protein